MNHTRLSEVLGVKKTEKRKRVLTIGLIVSGLLTIAFAIITFYGQYSGNFVMTVDDDAYRRGIILSDKRDFDTTSSRLVVNPLSDAKDTSYEYLSLTEAVSTDADYVDEAEDYVAYTFYLMNNGIETIDVMYRIRITEVHKNLDKAIRFMIIENGRVDEGGTLEYDEMSIYMKPDGEYENGISPYPIDYPQTTLFESDTMVCQKRIKNFTPGEIRKYTILIWIEGWDPSSVNYGPDSVAEGKIRASMSFSIVEEEQQEV